MSKVMKDAPLKHAAQPSVSLTAEALIIRIPWHAVAMRGMAGGRAARRMTADDVLQLVDAGRLAHRLGKTRAVHSLKDLSG